MNEKLKVYIENNLIKENKSINILGNLLNKKSKRSNNIFYDEELCLEKSIDVDKSINKELNVDNFIDSNKDENNFQKLLFNFIDKKKLKDSDVYNKVHMDRRLFSKIRSDINYHPSKDTIILLGLSLELNEEEIEQLLSSASYSLPKNNYYDLIIRFCFVEGIYKLKDVNDLLDSYNCKLFNY